MNTVERTLLLMLKQNKELDTYRLYTDKHFSPAQISQFLLKYIPKGYVYKKGRFIRRTIWGRIMINRIPLTTLSERGTWKDIPVGLTQQVLAPNQPFVFKLSPSQRHRIISKSEM